MNTEWNNRGNHYEFNNGRRFGSKVDVHISREGDTVNYSVRSGLFGLNREEGTNFVGASDEVILSKLAQRYTK